MGDRGNVQMIYDDGNSVYFYTHWDGYKLPKIVQTSLIRGEDRWNDEPYLARIIFSEMIKTEVMEEIGYAIAPYLMENENPIVVVNCSKQTVTIGDEKACSFKQYIKRKL